MKGSTRKKKNSGLRKTSAPKIPLPGPAGLEVLGLIQQGKIQEAMMMFYEEFIGDPRFGANIQILEDDGDAVVFMADRGVYKVSGIGREMLAIVINGPGEDDTDDADEAAVDAESAEDKAEE
jgi:hypothetical protein